MPVNTGIFMQEKINKTKQSYTNLNIKEKRGINYFICQMVKNPW